MEADKDNIFIPYEKALSILEANTIQMADEIRSLRDCTGQFLAEDLNADRDFPPFDRVTMDGIAIKYRSFEKGLKSFPIEKVSPAGAPQAILENQENCIEIMTGAMLPINTDTVIRYEDLEISNGVATLTNLDIVKAQNVHFKGMDIPVDTLIVKKGKQLSSAEINIAAAVGKANLKIKKLPTTVIISTGDELVDVGDVPLPHQIRRSNVYGIRNTLNEWGIKATMEHLPDEKDKMTRIIEKLLGTYELLIFTGGVSKGKYDHLPDVLKALKIKRHFHKIQQRPGKPFWFGTATNGSCIFALPGNPVSSFVCIYAYLRFWLLKSLKTAQQKINVKLLNEVHFKPDLTYFPEATLKYLSNAELGAETILGNGSGDFANLVKTDGFLVLPQNKTIFKEGEIYPFIPYRNHF